MISVQATLKKLFPGQEVSKGEVSGDWAHWNFSVNQITFRQLNSIKKAIPRAKIVLVADRSTKDKCIVVVKLPVGGPLRV